jgi:DNA-binding CsgD family transcriptional regulator
MAVIVEVPDATTARLARRLVARRAGVSVIVADGKNRVKQEGANTADGEPVRRIVIGSPESLPGGAGHRSAALLRQGIWAVIPNVEADINRSLRGYVDDVRAGLCPLLDEISRDHGQVVELVEGLQKASVDSPGGQPSGGENPLSELECEILRLISLGVTSREIAGEMGFQLQTVKNKVTVILIKSHARSRTHAVSIALANGWIPAPQADAK